MIIKILRQIFGKIFKWLSDHPVQTLLGALGIGATTVTIGTIESQQAKKVNKKALDIQQEALATYEKEYDKTICILNQLGDSKKRTIDSFQRFADLMEEIKERPEFKTTGFFSVELPDYQLEEIKKMSEDVQMIIAGTGGAIVGILGGLAAFGGAAIAAAPGMITGGLIICAKGHALKKKAVSNVKQAKDLRKNVEKITEFYSALQTMAGSVQCMLDTDYLVYDNYLKKVAEIISNKKKWKDFTCSERKIVEHTVMLARILYEICKMSLVLKTEDADQLETINYQEVKKIKRQEKEIFNQMKKDSSI